MKPFFHNSPHFKKWSLLGMLVFALGFNLSMNPEYFNNIARNEYSKYSKTELASENSFLAGSLQRTLDEQPKIELSPEFKDMAARHSIENARTNPSPRNFAPTEAQNPTFVSRGAQQPQNTELADGKEVVVRVGENLHKGKVVKYENRFTIKVSGVNDDWSVCQGGVTGNCVKEIEVPNNLNHIVEAVDAIERTIQQTVKAEEVPEKDDEKKEEDESRALAKKLRDKVKALAKTCDKVEKSSKLDCHIDNLISLSNDETLKDEDGIMKAVTEYYNNNIQRRLESAMDPGVESEEDFEALNEAQELYEKLWSELDSENGKSVRRSMLAMKGRRYSKIARNGQNRIRQGMQLMESCQRMAGFCNAQDYFESDMMVRRGFSEIASMNNGLRLDLNWLNQSISSFDDLSTGARRDYRNMMGDFRGSVGSYIQQISQMDVFKSEFPEMLGLTGDNMIYDGTNTGNSIINIARENIRNSIGEAPWNKIDLGSRTRVAHVPEALVPVSNTNSWLSGNNNSNSYPSTIAQYMNNGNSVISVGGRSARQ